MGLFELRQKVIRDFRLTDIASANATFFGIDWLNSICFRTIEEHYMFVDGSAQPFVIVFPLVRVGVTYQLNNSGFCNSSSCSSSGSQIVWANRSEALDVSMTSTAISMDIFYMIYSPQSVSVAAISVHFTEDLSYVGVDVYRSWPSRIFQLYLGSSCLFLSLVSMILDIKELVKRYRVSKSIRLVKIYSLLNTFALPLVIGLQVFWFEYFLSLPQRIATLLSVRGDALSLLSESESFVRIKYVKYSVQCLSCLLLGSASVRLFRILSAHPRTEVLIAVMRNAKIDLMHFSVTAGFVLGYFTWVWWTVSSKNIWTLVEWLLQVPFAQWSFDGTNTLLLLIYGIIAYHFLLNYLLIIVSTAFSEYRAGMKDCLVSNAFAVDVVYSVKRWIHRISSRKKWPHRLVLLCALGTVKAHRGHISKGDFLQALDLLARRGKDLVNDPDEGSSKLRMFRSKLVTLHENELKWDQSSNEIVWEWYKNQFGDTFLAPLTQDQVEEDHLQKEIDFHRSTVHIEHGGKHLSDLELADLDRCISSLESFLQCFFFLLHFNL